jgi:hypothetical protein
MYGGRNDLGNLKIDRRKLGALLSKPVNFFDKSCLAKETIFVSLATYV